MALVVGDTIRERIEEIEAQLAEYDEALQPLHDEHKALTKVLRSLERATNGIKPVSDEAVIEAIRTAGKALNSHGVAEVLGVGPRNVARKLRKLVDSGVLKGNPEKGYTLRAGVAAKASATNGQAGAGQAVQTGT